MNAEETRANCTDPPGEYGDIRVIGINCTDAVAGRIEICVEGEWTAVCHNRWGLADATMEGIGNFSCNYSMGNDLIECRLYNRCSQEAGIICGKPLNKGMSHALYLKLQVPLYHAFLPHC